MRLPLLLLLAFACVSLPPPAQAQDKVVLRYGQIAASARSVSSLGLNVAQRKGFLAREGIELRVLGLRGVQYQIEELDKGNVELSYTATPYLIQQALAGSTAVGVVGGPANTIYSLLAKPQIKTYEELRGKVVGLSLPVDTITIATRMLLDKHGLKDGAVRTRELIGTPVRAECLDNGECDAVPLSQPEDIVFMQRGFTKLGDSLEVIPALQFGVVAARREWAAANKDVVARVARAFGNAYKFMRDYGNRDEVANIAVETTGASSEVTRAMLDFYYEPDRGVMPRQGEISMAGLAKVIELLGMTGELKSPLPRAERFVDLQYLRAARMQ